MHWNRLNQVSFLKKIDSTVYWLANNFMLPKEEKDPFHLLPAYDEFIISYKNRRAVLTMDNHNKAISSNGIFYPTIVKEGQAVGTWKRTVKNDRVIPEVELYDGKKVSKKKLIEKAALRFSSFLSKKLELIYKN